MKFKVHRDALGITGLVIAFLGLLANPWLVGWLLNPSGRLGSRTLFLALAVFSAAGIAKGLYLAFADRRGLRRNLPNFALLAGTVAVTLAVAYTGYLAYRSARMYQYVKTNQRGWKGSLFQGHPELGYAPRPNSRGFMTFHIGPDLPVRHDANGFRVPENAPDDPEPRRPVILTLGCSATYADACLAEEGYGFQLAQALGGTCVNAAMCGYGLEQTLVQAQRLIPELKPDLVIVQYSGWLVARSLQGFAPSYLGQLPVPYFDTTAAGQIALQPALFREKIFEVPVADYQNEREGSAGEFLSFFFRAGLPLLLHDDRHAVRVRLQDALSRLLRDRPLLPGYELGNEVVEYVYGEIGRMCREHDARMVVVLYGLDKDERLRFQRPAVPGAAVANADSALYSRLPDRTRETYYRAYAHWRGDPPECVDAHPNAAAHAIIAQTIVEAVRTKDDEVIVHR
ncbi:MAG: hypothetical protein C4524_04730 [Candidatus Zixiibacteriota bacterium]|nr:MAG: hypothetical protein C4524_04730 [candidate division Zixibacteria bacterium]